jgi:tetrahydromethanopterin S-methyltransferase subunit C
LLIAIFIWIVTSFTVGIQGFLPCIFDMKRIISIGFCALIFTLSAIGLKKAMLSKKAGEVRSKELKIGYTGNLIIVVIFALINFNNAFDIYLFLKGDYN